MKHLFITILLLLPLCRMLAQEGQLRRIGSKQEGAGEMPGRNCRIQEAGEGTRRPGPVSYTHLEQGHISYSQALPETDVPPVVQIVPSKK